MKIALVSPYDYPYPGGVTEHISHLEANLRKLGHEVIVIAPSSKGEEELRLENIYKVGSVVPIPANGSVARITLSVHRARQVKAILEREQCDVVHLHEPLVPALPLTVLLFSKAVNVGTFHRFGGSGIPYFYGRPVLRRFFGRLHGRIAVSWPAYRFISRYFPGDYTIIPNGIGIEEFGEQVEPLPALRDGRPNILFVGRLDKRKGLRYLLDAFPLVREAFPQARLIVAGAYGSRPQRRYESYARQRGIGDVIFTGPLPRQELCRYYKSCDVFCAPSTGGESFGIVLLEAMASGKPIVASNIEGYKQLVEDGEEGFLTEPKDIRALASGINRLLGDDSLRLAMGMEGREKASAYAWPEIARRVVDYYHQAAEEKARRATESHRRRRWRIITSWALRRATRALWPYVWKKAFWSNRPYGR